MEKLPSSAYAGQTITFTGKLASNGQPLSGKLVYIKEDDPLKPDQQIGFARTDTNGRFSIPWKIGAGLVEVDFDFYAVYEGDSSYKQAKSYNQEVSILKYGGGITLDQFPRSVNEGDVVTFSGSLQLNIGSPEGAIVYIKDEDPLDPDDLLATAYVNSNGRFSANWFATKTDVDQISDIYAVFEGNEILYRLTTCDPGQTMSFGGTCSNTISLRVVPTSTIQPPTGVQPTGNEYMVLYHSLDFANNPKVAIVPSPDSYGDVSRYIIPTQEGVLMWNSKLQSKFGGNWNVDFEIIPKGALFYNKKPDIIMNLVTRDDEVGCGKDFAGLAYITTIRPINTIVCTNNGNYFFSTSDVSATSAHEFIHAMGLGHAFNKAGDLMCSIENGKQTCNNLFSKSKLPSDFNLAATAKLYGSDGFKNPNNRIVYGAKFTAADYNNGNYDAATTTLPTTPSYPSTSFQDSDKDGILDSKDRCPYVKEVYNGYKDDDGCADSVPITSDTWKTKTLKLQTDVNYKIKSLKTGVYTAQDSLYATSVKNSQAKKELDKAWEALWWAKKYLGDAEWTQKEGEQLIKKSKFQEAYFKYQYSWNSAEKINPYLFDISTYINNAKKLDK